MVDCVEKWASPCTRRRASRAARTSDSAWSRWPWSRWILASTCIAQSVMSWSSPIRAPQEVQGSLAQRLGFGQPALAVK